MINDPTADQSAVRAPRLRVLSGGVVIDGALKASTVANNYYQADHFTVSFAASASPVAWWDNDDSLMLDIQVSIQEGAWQSLIIGEVDHISFHPTTGLLEMEGRDLSARMIEAKTQEAFLNQTASEVATTIAGRHGLTPHVTPTTTLVGRYYEQDHSKVTLDQFSRTTTEWDLLFFLASREGFDVYVYGSALYFQPSVDPSADPFVLNWTAASRIPRLNAVSMSFERSKTLAKDIEVSVRSWNSRQGRGFTKVARAIGGKAAAASSSKTNTTQKYSVVRPNLTEDQALKLATQMAHEITLHERIVSVEMPGELVLTPRNMVKVQGTGTSWDQTYFTASIDRSISFEEGFRQSMRLKNSSPRTTTQV